MKRPALGLLLLGVIAGAGAPWRAAAGTPSPMTIAQHPGLPQPPAPPPDERGSAAVPHRSGELECRTCHRGEHQGVVRMYLGVGGRGTPMIPSHMFQVRVECVACHIAPKEPEPTARIVGQTFRPSEQACVGCHGDRYRGMLERWQGTLGRMRAIVEPKLAAARAALGTAGPGNPKVARARGLAQDAEFNLRFVVLGKGVHNVFYAADLLKLSNAWLDEASRLLARPAPTGDDTLVRGGYCAVLCHEQAGVKQRATVTFGRQTVPHVRHVTEFGAVCTACHSAEVHKKVTATPAACSSCHHSPQNERCESCHRAQSAFYRGGVKTPLVRVEPNSMVNAVGCTGCHDFSAKHSRRAVAEKCVGCHDPSYLNFMTEWTTGVDREAQQAGEALRRAEAALARGRRGGRPAPEGVALAKEAREALDLVRKARGVHNPAAAEALLQAARRKAEAALAAAR